MQENMLNLGGFEFLMSSFTGCSTTSSVALKHTQQQKLTLASQIAHLC